MSAKAALSFCKATDSFWADSDYRELEILIKSDACCQMKPDLLQIINSLIKLLVFQVMGEIVVFGISMSVPGPVVGMLLLFLYLVLRGHEDEGLTAFSARFLSHLPLLFIPAPVGIMLHLNRVAAEWLPILIALSGSTVVSILVTAVVVRRLKKD